MNIKNFLNRICITAAIVLILMFCVPMTAHAADTSEPFYVEYIDVGQGDCALIQCDGRYMMIDGGPASASSTVYNILKQKGIKNIDVMIATHPDADHTGGLSGALNYAYVGTCYSPVTSYDSSTFKSVVRYLARQNRKLTVPKAGDEFTLGSAKVEILGPVTTYEDDTNNNSIVTKVTYGDTSFLFMGDAEKEEEFSLIRSNADLACDVIKIGHHGSAYSTTSMLLSKAKPEYAVISVGAANTYGHPEKDVLRKLENRKIALYRTDLEGDITFTSDGKNISVSTEKTTDTDKLWTAGPSDASSDTSGSSETVPEGTTYVLNVRTKKFHLPDCDSVQDISELNRIYSTETAEDLISEGYSPCGKCKPDGE